MTKSYPVEADLSLPVAGGEVGLGLGCGALGTDSVTHALVSALGLLSALLVTTLVGALGSAARTLAGTGGRERRRLLNNYHRMSGRSNCSTREQSPHLPADFVGLQFAFPVVRLVGVIAALVPALIAVATVTLLPRLHQAVATDGLT